MRLHKPKCTLKRATGQTTSLEMEPFAHRSSLQQQNRANHGSFNKLVERHACGKCCTWNSATKRKAKTKSCTAAPSRGLIHLQTGQSFESRFFQDLKSKCSKYHGCFQKYGKTPQIIHFNRVFYYFHHPFWVPLFLETPICCIQKQIS